MKIVIDLREGREIIVSLKYFQDIQAEDIANGNQK